MTYHEITVAAAPELHDALAERMRGLGAIGFLEGDETLTGYFEEKNSSSDICAGLEEFRPLLAASGLESGFTISLKELPDRDWNETWKKSFSAIDVGENLTIIPSWLVSETGRIPIIIDPGMVFGTGHHETTRTCLGLIEKYAAASSRENFLDIGTGTGILAVAAGRLGFRNVTALDIDPLAVDAARRNAAANGLEMTVVEGTVEAAGSRYDLISANLLVEILVAIAPEVAARLQPGGRAILSGLLLDQAETAARAMAAAGLREVEKIVDGKWVSLVMEK